MSQTLANGLEVLVQPDFRLPLVALETWYLIGSAHEPPALPGLAHLCEHLCFSGPGGNAERSYLALVQRLGGTANAATSHDHTRYSQLLPRRELELGLWLEAQRMSGAAAEDLAVSFEVQRRILVQELRQPSAGRPFELLHRLLYPPDHAYHRPPAGTVEGVETIRPEDVTAFLSRGYAPANARLVIAGDVEPEVALALVERYLGGIAAGPGRLPGPSLPAALAADRQRVSAPELDAALTCCAWSVGGFGTRSWHQAFLAAGALAVGAASPLQQLASERGVARQVTAHVLSMAAASTLVLAAVAAPGISAEHLEAALASTLETALALPWLPAQVRRACARRRCEHYAELADLTLRAEHCARLAAAGEVPRQLLDMADLDEVGAAELADFCCQLRQSPVRAWLSLVPEEERC